MRSRLKITYCKSGIGSSLSHRRTLRALGLRTLGQSVFHVDRPSLQGMIRKVAHLVRVEVVEPAALGPEGMAGPVGTPVPQPERPRSAPAVVESGATAEKGRPSRGKRSPAGEPDQAAGPATKAKVAAKKRTTKTATPAGAKVAPKATARPRVKEGKVVTEKRTPTAKATRAGAQAPPAKTDPAATEEKPAGRRKKAEPGKGSRGGATGGPTA